ncbi:rhomboid family intramembrane serine protease [Lutibacter sp. B2]|nr:rhomboid family intramembrane serine protease [Lutibacter sp. B2]
MFPTVAKIIKEFIEKKEFFLYPHKTVSEIFDVVLYKQNWFSNDYIHFVNGNDFFYNSLEYKKSIIYNQYKEMNKQNKFKKLSIYTIIFIENCSIDFQSNELKELYSFIEKENIKTNLLLFDLSSRKVIDLFCNFTDHENMKTFVNDNVLNSNDEFIESINLLEIEHMTKSKKGYDLPATKPYITYILISLNIFMFLIMSLFGGTTNVYNLIRFGAKYNPLIIEGEYYRLITSMFIHIGITHLLFNMYALNMLGKDIEKMYGHIKYILIYFTAGIGGSFMSFLFSPSVSAGASGAIFGLMGAYVSFGLKRPNVFFSRYGMNIITLIVINIGIGLMMPSIDNFGHLGGFIGGIIASFIFGLKKNFKRF